MRRAVESAACGRPRLTVSGSDGGWPNSCSSRRRSTSVPHGSSCDRSSVASLSAGALPTNAPAGAEPTSVIVNLEATRCNPAALTGCIHES